MPGAGLGRNHNSSGKQRLQRSNRRMMLGGITQGRPDGAVAENLAASTEALRPANRLGLPVRLADVCRRLGQIQRKSGQNMVVQHQHHKQVQLHEGQQPGGGSSP